ASSSLVTRSPPRSSRGYDFLDSSKARVITVSPNAFSEICRRSSAFTDVKMREESREIAHGLDPFSGIRKSHRPSPAGQNPHRMDINDILKHR
ncbi:MAG: hypothetical protein WCG52_11435, partial [bacterium]